MCVAHFSDPHKHQTPVSHMKLKQLADGSYASHTENSASELHLSLHEFIYK